MIFRTGFIFSTQGLSTTTLRAMFEYKGNMAIDLRIPAIDTLTSPKLAAPLAMRWAAPIVGVLRPFRT